MPAEYVWSITDAGQTGARWGFRITVDDNGRGITVARAPEWTDLSNVQTADVCFEIVDAAQAGPNVWGGGSWEDLATPQRVSWPDYGLEVILRFWSHSAGVFQWASHGIPAHNPHRLTTYAGLNRVGGEYEIGENGSLRLATSSSSTGDWELDDRPEIRPTTPALRYTTIERVELGMRSPTNPEARSWQTGKFDDHIAAIIRGVESWIDGYCGRRFDEASATPSVRTYPRPAAEHVDTDDYIGSAPDGWAPGRVVAVEGNTPVYRGVKATAMTASQLIRAGDAALPEISVSARWGWPRVPDGVSWAASLMSIRRFKRTAETSLGILPVGEEGALYISAAVDPDVEAALSPYRRVRI